NGPGPIPAISITFTPSSGPMELDATSAAEQSARVVGHDRVERRPVDTEGLEAGPEVREKERVRALVHLLVHGGQDLLEHVLHPGRDRIREASRREAAHVVLGEAEPVGMARVDDGLDAVRPLLVGGQDLVADAVEANERAPLGDRDVLGRVGGLALVAYHATIEVDTVLLEDVLLHVAAL